MVANVMLIVKREFDYSQERVFKTWTAPEEMMLWRDSPGWHVERRTVSSELKLGGEHHHVKIRDNDPAIRVTTDAIFTEYFDPGVLVARQRITGDSGVNPDIPMELYIEFTKYDGGILVRIVQGPYEPSRAEYHVTGWEREPDRLEDFLAADPEGASRRAQRLCDRSRS